MAFASATKVQRQAVRDRIVNTSKVVEAAVETGPVLALGPIVDEQAALLVAALSAAGTGSGGTTAVVTNGQKPAVTGTGAVATITVVDGVVGITLSAA